MCGIAGVLGGGSEADLALAQSMIDALAHRGPDGVRVERFDDAVLAHARLSIIDLEGGWQPLHAAGSVVVGNGEIYNYKELAAEFGLEAELATGSDFEPMLHLYAREGERVFDRLRGMYAFCLRGCDGRTWLVRDPFGIKPLHILERPGRLFFASEPSALWRTEARPADLAPDQVGDLLALNFLLPGREEVSGARALPPGAVVEVEGARPRADRIRAALPKAGARPSVRLPDAVRSLDAVLERSVEVHQRSDAPYGLFLSGGLDSAAVAVLMARLNARPVTAFTCGFTEKGVADERPQAERLARALDLDWREVSFGHEEFARLAPEAAAALDLPTSDFAVLPTLRLAEEAKGVLKVVLTGEGGDELLAGYGRYRRALRPRVLGGRPAEPQINRDLPPMEAAVGGALERWRSVAAEAGAAAGGDGLWRAQAADVAAWLPNDLLLKLDRSLMAHGLEGRTPFLDPEVAAFAATLPRELKVRGRHGKWLLRTWMRAVRPEAAPFARKRGFTVPVEAFIERFGPGLGAKVSQSPVLKRSFETAAIEAVYADPSRATARWPLLFLALWWSIHAEGLSAAEARARYFEG